MSFYCSIMAVELRLKTADLRRYIFNSWMNIVCRLSLIENSKSSLRQCTSLWINTADLFSCKEWGPLHFRIPRSVDRAVTVIEVKSSRGNVCDSPEQHKTLNRKPSLGAHGVTDSVLTWKHVGAWPCGGTSTKLGDKSCLEYNLVYRAYFCPFVKLHRTKYRTSRQSRSTQAHMAL